MSSTYYKLYRKDMLTLAKSMVIKHSDVAESVNDQLRQQGYVIDLDRPETWKYYLNLNGEYHQSDQMITVRSMDTLETIPFTKANLKVHRATYREYLPGGRFYYELLEAHPNKTDLIHGILHPVNIDTALEAKDGTILYYDTSLVESNEDNLIWDLQVWIYGFYARWHNRQYVLTDDLYLPAFLGHLYLQLPATIERLRLRNVRTRYVHSFHVREYLASHNGLDRYMPYLTKGQQLWLYRNIRYVQRHVGKQTVFMDLVKNILSVRSIPLQGYDISRVDTPLLEGELYPEIEMVKRPINVDYIQSGRPTESVNTILNRQWDLTRDNPKVMDQSEAETYALMTRDQYSNLPTKVLESEIVDRTGSSIRSLSSVLINEWLHLVTSGRFSGFITLTHPATGSLVTMSVKDAFIVALFAFNKIHGLEMETIPSVYAYEVLRTPLPGKAELESIIDRKFIPDGMVEAIRDRITPHGEYITPDQFNAACVRLHEEQLKLWELYSFQEHYLNRGFCEQLVKRHFMHIKCRLVDEIITFEDWMTQKGFDFASLSTLDLGTLFTECVNRSTGANLTDKRSLSEIQRMLLGLLGQLSSYSVHYLQNINSEDFTYLASPGIRLGDISASSEMEIRTQQPWVFVRSMRAEKSHDYRLGSEYIDPPIDAKASTCTTIRIESDVRVRRRMSAFATAVVNVSDVGIRSYHGVVDYDTPDSNDLSHYQPPTP